VLLEPITEGLLLSDEYKNGIFMKIFCIYDKNGKIEKEGSICPGRPCGQLSSGDYLSLLPK
jgi:antitoxin component YwqK of YwqJK toxin-antitoxin module